MLDRRAYEQVPQAAPREMPRLPALSDHRLVAALTRNMDGRDLPFGARLPEAARLVSEAIFDGPPTVLHDRYQRLVGEVLGALAAAAGGVAAAAGALSPVNAFNAFRQVGVTTSNTAVATGTALSGGRTARYTLSVLHIALAQENMGHLLPRESPAGLGRGFYATELVTRHRTVTLRVDVGDDDSNEVLLSRLAVAINDERVGLLATIARPTMNLVQLVVTARETGADSAFSFADSPLVTLTGAHRVTRPAQDAGYVLNGVRTLAPENVVRMQGGMVQLTLLRALPEQALNVLVGADTEVVLAAVAQLADAASSLARVVREHASSLSTEFVDDFRAASQGINRDIAEIGLELAEDGALDFDRSMFVATFQNDPERVEAIIASPQGLAVRLGDFASQVVSAPMSSFGAPQFVPAVPVNSHPTPQLLMASNTLSALMYSQLFAQGLFINSQF